MPNPPVPAGAPGLPVASIADLIEALRLSREAALRARGACEDAFAAVEARHPWPPAEAGPEAAQAVVAARLEAGLAAGLADLSRAAADAEWQEHLHATALLDARPGSVDELRRKLEAVRPVRIFKAAIGAYELRDLCHLAELEVAP